MCNFSDNGNCPAKEFLRAVRVYGRDIPDYGIIVWVTEAAAHERSLFPQ
jgi:hypothetical protein